YTVELPIAPRPMTMASNTSGLLFPVRNPDVLHLRRVPEEFPSCSLLPVDPVAAAALAPRLLHVPRRRQLARAHALRRTEVPDRVHVVVLREHLRELVAPTRDDVHDA